MALAPAHTASAFMIGEVEGPSGAPRAPGSARRTPMRIVDPALMLDAGEKWTKLYESIFLSPRR